MFNVVPDDIGRPLSDLNASVRDSKLLADAEKVLKTSAPVKCEIQAGDGTWYVRRILPYRTQGAGVEGVVITFADVTERHKIEDALDVAKRQAESANAAKTRFLAAASHDLRQPLQTLTLLQGLLAKSVQGEKGLKLLTRLGDAIGAMSGMLNTLLDINQIEAGTVHAVMSNFPINDLLRRLHDEFSYQAEAQGLALTLVECSRSVESDPRLLEQILRNLMSNALKYTRTGRLLVGCRRRGAGLSIEIWDTGIGIADEQLLAIFDEYHQLDNDARERSRGLGLGLSIVRHLANLLGHQVKVHSHLGKGSVFAVEIAQPLNGAANRTDAARRSTAEPANGKFKSCGAILVVDDDPDLRELLATALTDEGHFVAAAHDGHAALKLLAQGAIRPDMLLADFNLPGNLNGLQLAAQIRKMVHSQLPVMILTGDITTATLREIAQSNCAQLNKPVRFKELADRVKALMPSVKAISDPLPRRADAVAPQGSLIHVVDDDANTRRAIRSLLEDEDFQVEDYDACELFLERYRPRPDSALLIDAYLPGMKGLELLRRLHAAGDPVPIIMITGQSDVSIAVLAMKSGASDFLEKPFNRDELLVSIRRVLEQARDAGMRSSWHSDAAERIGRLTPRQNQIMELVLAGQHSKNIAADLNISQRTVENHRASIMEKTGTKSLPALARLALAASEGKNPKSPH